MEKIILIGGGGHCKVIIDAILKGKQYEIEGIIDPNISIGKKVLNIPVIGKDDNLLDIYNRGIKNAFIAVGSIGDFSTIRKREEIYQKLKMIGFSLPIIVHPAAVIADECSLDEGIFVAAGAVINSGTRVGKNTILNTLSSIDHDCQIADFVHIAPGTNLSGGVTIGKFTHIGVGTVVNQGINIGCNCLIGSGSVVVKDIIDNLKAFGNPCKAMEKR